ncbi:MAG: MBL fold metallo-hydrolase [Erysipelotrichaceae bacterium]|nr:MBL fold metallo-hydrolase [Erysipelotrichaceae bacterium]
MKATILVDNISNNDLMGEWGLSIYIEYKDKKVLLDTGLSSLFLENAGKLNLPIEDIDMGVLSHAHYDHANGMEAFFENNAKALFYVGNCGENCYSREFFIFHRYVGIPKGLLNKYEKRIVYVREDINVSDGISLITHKTKNLEVMGKRDRLELKKNGRYVWDNYEHEISLVFDTDDGLVIFNSCSHAGAANIIKEVESVYPDKKVKALIGGFHLYNKSEKEVRAFAKLVKDTGIKDIYTGHCTGDKAFEILKEELGDTVKQIYTGLVMEF